MNDLKEIHLGKFIKLRWKELNISIERTCNFFELSESEVFEMFRLRSLDSEYILRWSKLLEYDFFRLYSQHLLLYSPASPDNKKNNIKKSSQLPAFRKSLYTREIIDFIMELLISQEKTKQQIIDEYRIPKTTLYKWISKYSKSEQ